MRKNNVKILSYSCILLSVSLILSYIEVLFPFYIGEIGIKVGLCNIVSILGIKTIGYLRTLLINILRLIICGFLFANVVRFSISVGGFLLSYAVMCVLFEYVHFSIITTSIFGGVFHNIGQFITLIIIMGNASILYLLPAYLIVGIVTGLLVGIIAKIIIKYN